MKIHSTILRLGAACVALTFAGLLRADEETSTSSIKFSDPAKPGTLKLLLPWADVHVTGTDGNEVVVTSSLNDKRKHEVRKDGLRRLDDEVSFALSESGNVVVVAIVGENAWAAHGSEFSIKVPRSTSLVVRTEAGGDIEVEKVEGDLDINSMNGEVTLHDIASSAVINTMNGEIHATFKQAPVKPVSFSTMNGEISLFLPGDTKANLRMRTHNGSILTDFSADLLKTKNEPRAVVADEADNRAPLAPGMPIPPVAPVAPVAGQHAESDDDREVSQEIRSAMIGGKSITGTLNGGGVDISLTSMNGTVTVRHTK